MRRAGRSVGLRSRPKCRRSAAIPPPSAPVSHRVTFSGPVQKQNREGVSASVTGRFLRNLCRLSCGFRSNPATAFTELFRDRSSDSFPGRTRPVSSVRTGNRERCPDEGVPCGRETDGVQRPVECVAAALNNLPELLRTRRIPERGRPPATGRI